MQVAALPDGRPQLRARRRHDAEGAVAAVGVGGQAGRAEVRDVLGERMLGADGGDADIGGLARLGERVIARVEVFALLAAVRTGLRVRAAGSVP